MAVTKIWKITNNTDNIPEIGKMLINDGIKNNELEFKLHVG